MKRGCPTPPQLPTLQIREAREKEEALRIERERKKAEEGEARREAEERAARMIREQKERLAEKLEQWRDEEARQAGLEEGRGMVEGGEEGCSHPRAARILPSGLNLMADNLLNVRCLLLCKICELCYVFLLSLCLLAVASLPTVLCAMIAQRVIVAGCGKPATCAMFASCGKFASCALCACCG